MLSASNAFGISNIHEWQVRNSLRRDRVTMVQAAESGRGVNLVSKCSTDRGWPTRWRVFREPQVRSVFVVVAHILGHQSFQMPLVQDDDVVQQFPPATSHPTLRHPVLPWTRKAVRTGWLPMPFTDDTTSLPNFESWSNNKNLGAGAYGHASRICCTIQRAFGFRVTLQQRIFRRSWPMTKKQYRTPNVSVGTVKKLHRCDGLTMISQEGQPALGGIGRSPGPSQPSRDRRFREIKTQLEQFSVNARRSPGWIFSRHAENQGSYLRAHTPPTAHSSSSGEPFPVQPKARSMPSHNRLRCDQHERLLPTGPESPQNNPEQLVHGRQSRTRSLGVQS